METPNSKLLLSIDVPVYNRENFIEECLNSILNQPVDKSLYEIICVDDGSKDNSLSILRGYEEKYSNIKVFSQENQGASSARNYGIDKATGKYIWFIDSDDFLYNDVLNDVLNVLIEESPSILTIPTTYIHTFSDNFITKGESIDVAMYSWGNVALLQDIKKNGIRYDEKIRFGEDTLFWYTLYAYSDVIIFYHKNIYSYRRHEGSIMSSAYSDIETINRRTLDIIKACSSFQKLIQSKKDISKVKKEKINRIKNDLFQYLLEDVFPFSTLPYKETMKEFKKNKLYPCKFKKNYLVGCVKSKGVKVKLAYFLLFLSPIEMFYKILYKTKHKKVKNLG